MADTTRFNITEFKTLLEREGGLSRGVFFDCKITRNNAAYVFGRDQVLMCKAANMPTAQLDVAEIRYFTRQVKIPAARQFSPITLTFYNPQSYTLRNQFLTWLSRFNTPISNVRNAKDTDPIGGDIITDELGGDVNDNYATIELRPKNETHETRGVYRFYKAFPVSVGGLQYSYENDTQVHTYDVEFQYLSTTFTVGEG